MSGPELPVIYENPRFDQATPTLWPVFDRSTRFVLVTLIEWGSLTLIEDAPRYIKVATLIIAAIGLAVHESWPWLRMRDWRWYPTLMTILAASYLIVFCYALYSDPPRKSSLGAETAADLVRKPSRSRGTISELLDETGTLLDTVSKSALIMNDWGQLVGQNPEAICLAADRGGMESRKLQESINLIASRLEAAQASVSEVFDKNGLDSKELTKAFGMVMGTPNSFGGQANSLREYAKQIMNAGEHPTCDSLIQQNILHIQSTSAARNMDELNRWIGRSQLNLTDYRTALREELMVPRSATLFVSIPARWRRCL